MTGTAPDGQQFESTIEEDFFVLLRFNRSVASFEAQPVKVEWLDAKGKIHTYTPDVLVHYHQDMDESVSKPPLLCEIKPDHPEDAPQPVKRKHPYKENAAENALKWAAAKRYATAQGWEFSVFREKDVRTPYLKNVRFLLRALEKVKDSHFQPELLEKLDENGSLTLDEWAGTLASTLEARAKVLPACYRLIALQRVEVDLEQPLTLQSMVRAMSHA
ncbi:TnsA endonuclease N-terminal domain-containing protein [Sulfuricella denitrificans]|uniref:TnsA endonuclease N-terminal domain-containing protein n=1 Tax=Sulfuricella denitrificans TaxID=649841 RepID=UPI0003131371|nr:TnsA endonuclease N-terminal domain-containing protein [Sulfuricella denitrificans]